MPSKTITVRDETYPAAAWSLRSAAKADKFVATRPVNAGASGRFPSDRYAHKDHSP